MSNDGLSGEQRSADVSGDVSQELLRVVCEADQPLTSANILKQAATPRKIKAAEAIAILDQLVAVGSLHQIPPKTAKGKPLYWDRDPKHIASAAALSVVEQALDPVTVSEVGKQIKLPFKLTSPEVASILSELVQSGQIHEIPAKTAKSGPRYWNKDTAEYSQRTIVTLLEDKGPQPETSIKSSVKWLDAAQSKRLIQELIQSRAICVHPPVGTSKKIIYGTRPPAPEPYLKKVEGPLRSTVELLTQANVSPVELRRAVVQMLESAGVSIGPSTGSVERGTAPAKSFGDLIAMMKQIESAAERGALVSARDLRRATGLTKAEFDSRALALAQRGELVLHQHDFASSLSPAERDELITDGRGAYYVGLALRPETRAS